INGGSGFSPSQVPSHEQVGREEQTGEQPPVGIQAGIGHRCGSENQHTFKAKKHPGCSIDDTSHTSSPKNPSAHLEPARNVPTVSAPNRHRVLGGCCAWRV